MAILQTTHHYLRRGTAKLELLPNSPTQRELVDTYQVRLWIHDHLVYDHVQSVRDWQMRHYYVEHIARMCCCIQSFIDKTLEGCIVENFADDKFWSPVYVQVDTDWLKVTASAGTERRNGPNVIFYLSLVQTEHRIGDVEKPSAGLWGEWQERITATILCTPEDAVRFGRQLLQEIAEVERQRIELGIPEYDDETPYLPSAE